LNLGDQPGALAALFEAQKAAGATQPAPDAAARRAALSTLESLLQDNAGALAQAISADFGGRSPHETQLLEIFPALEGIRHARRHLGRWMKPQRRATNFWFLPGRSRVMFQPLGVVGIVVPWNYPVYLAVGPMIAALAAGNRMLVKMSEAAPATGALFASLVARHFAPGQVAVVNGGPEVAQAFCALPFDHLLFTGSTAVGKQVMRAAAENLTPVTLELGGKSPAVVGRDFPVAEAASRILFGKCLNAGQTCIAPDYALVPEESVEAFVQGARDAVARLYPQLAQSPDYTSIVNDRQRERLDSLLTEAARAGATIVDLTPAFGTITSRKLAPRIVLGARDDTRLMQEEIFGPVLPVVPYRKLDDAIAYVNARPRPLALYVFDHDGGNVDRVLAETVSGGVSVNETLLHIAQEDLPFGGVGPSGMGRYHGRDGFETFSVKKAVFHQSRVNGLKLFRPPYGARFEALVKFLSR
jgi:coniferyl-aldehyde dehydrogenase